jgi:hypothetical protein
MAGPHTRRLTGSWTTFIKLVIVNQTTFSHKFNLINWGFVPENLLHIIKVQINPLMPELNPSVQRNLMGFLLGILLLEPCI